MPLYQAYFMTSATRGKQRGNWLLNWAFCQTQVKDMTRLWPARELPNLGS